MACRRHGCKWRQVAVARSSAPKKIREESEIRKTIRAALWSLCALITAVAPAAAQKAFLDVRQAIAITILIASTPWYRRSKKWSERTSSKRQQDQARRGAIRRVRRRLATRCAAVESLRPVMLDTQWTIEFYEAAFCLRQGHRTCVRAVRQDALGYGESGYGLRRSLAHRRTVAI